MANLELISRNIMQGIDNYTKMMTMQTQMQNQQMIQEIQRRQQESAALSLYRQKKEINQDIEADNTRPASVQTPAGDLIKTGDIPASSKVYKTRNANIGRGQQKTTQKAKPTTDIENILVPNQQEAQVVDVNEIDVNDLSSELQEQGITTIQQAVNYLVEKYGIKEEDAIAFIEENN